MKAAAVALRGLLAAVISGIGLEGAFLLAATASLSVFSLSFSAAGPWFVVGAMCLLISIALAMPRRG